MADTSLLEGAAQWVSTVFVLWQRDRQTEIYLYPVSKSDQICNKCKCKLGSWLPQLQLTIPYFLYVFLKSTLEVRIHNRMKKLQRPKRLAGGPASNDSLNKKQKTSNCGWSEHPDLPEGETLASLADYVASSWSELARKPNDIRLHRDFLDRTFALRRHEILTSPRPVKQMPTEYPSLKKFIHVRYNSFHAPYNSLTDSNKCNLLSQVIFQSNRLYFCYFKNLFFPFLWPQVTHTLYV